MMKSEYAREQVECYLVHAAGPVKIVDLVARAGFLTDDGDPRWIGAAVDHFDRAGQLRHVTCELYHDHDSECTVEWIAA